MENITKDQVESIVLTYFNRLSKIMIALQQNTVNEIKQVIHELKDEQDNINNRTSQAIQSLSNISDKIADTLILLGKRVDGCESDINHVRDKIYELNYECDCMGEVNEH